MSDAATETTGARGKARRGGFTAIALSVALAGAGACAGYFVSVSGLFPEFGVTQTRNDASAPRTAFVPVDPLIVTIARPGGTAQLRLQLDLEVAAGSEAEVAALMPRLLDAINTYLRALDTIDITETTTLVRLRSQLLRRMMLIAGEDVVKDVLIQEFVVN